MALRAAGRGAALVGVPLFLGVGGAAVGSLALFAIALGLLAAYVGCVLAVRIGARRLRVERTVSRQEVVEGRPVALDFAFSGLRGLPVHVEVRGPDGRWVALPPSGGRIECAIDRPGPHVVDASPLRVRDDLGLFSRPSRGGRPAALLVLPDPTTVAGVAPRGGADPVGDPEPDGLRPYVRGTPMSRVHWASAARGGELQERVFVTARDRLPLVVVDTGGGAVPVARDWAARTAAGHVLALVRAGGCRVLLPGDRRPTTITDAAGAWPAIHRRLASLEPGAPGRAAGGDERGAVHVRAAAAPAEALRSRGPLPPGVVPLAAWTGTV
ncbi:DUF58 domain-containing protein [Patulibacter sp. NPDC049589]|uniref:DUF58 domain-containing protein n=1 Tax=Patulibacter sp. NPDC049589 TaxID=3154731 RepID=UPI00343BBBDB